MMIGEVYLHNGNWKFNAIGNVSKDRKAYAVCMVCRLIDLNTVFKEEIVLC